MSSTSVSPNLRDILALFAELRRVGDLTGNCGRKVRRALEQALPQHAAVFPISFANLSLPQFAYLVRALKRTCALAVEDTQMANEPCVFCVQDIRVESRTLSIKVVASAPPVDGVRALQAWANTIAYGLSMVVTRLSAPIGSDADMLERMLFASLRVDMRLENHFSGGPTTLTPEQLAEVDALLSEAMAHFEALLAGDYSLLPQTNPLLVDLVAELVPEVRDEYTRCVSLETADVD